MPACKYCGRLKIESAQDIIAGGVHADHCPTKDANPEWAMREWDRGYDRGFGDEFIHYQSLRYYSIHFQRGYGEGKDEIDRQIEAAAEWRDSWQAAEY